MFDGTAKETSPQITIWDPYTDDEKPDLAVPAVFFVGTRHDQFKEFEYPRGSIVIDPFGYVNRQKGVTLIRIGRQWGDPA